MANSMILPSITTITPGAWREKLKEVKELKIKEVALFPTCLNTKQRQEFYKLVKEAGIKSVPLVHMRSQDMKAEEFDFLVKNFKVQVFNTHTQREYVFCEDIKKYSHNIYIENTYAPMDEKELKEFAGICLDFCHLENDRLMFPKKYLHNIKLIEKYKVGCNHISAIKPGPTEKHAYFKYSSHNLADLSELDYLKRYPLNYFSSLIAIELENSIKEQIEAIKYLKKNVLKA